MKKKELKLYEIYFHLVKTTSERDTVKTKVKSTKERVGNSFGITDRDAIFNFTPLTERFKKEYDFYDRIESENQYYIVQRKVTHISARQVRIPQPLGKYKILVERL